MLKGQSAIVTGSTSGIGLAIDGSKFKAVNNRDRNFTDAKTSHCRRRSVWGRLCP